MLINILQYDIDKCMFLLRDNMNIYHSRYCAISSQPEPKTMWVLGGDVQGTHTGMTSEILQHYSIKMENGSSTKTGFKDAVNAPKRLLGMSKCFGKYSKLFVVWL